MLDFIVIKNHLLESGAHNKKVLLALFYILSITLMLLIRLIYLQIYHYNHYTSLSNKNHIYIRPIPSTRGFIFDRNGKILARNNPSFSLDIIPEQIDDLKSSLFEINRIIKLKKNVYKNIKANKPSDILDYVTIKNNLTLEEVSRFYVHQYRFPGIKVNASLTRFYPYKDLFSHVIGYVGKISDKELKALKNKSTINANSKYIGKVGIEKYYETELHGNPGIQQVEVNVKGKIVNTLNKKNPISGNNIYITIDANLQKIANQALGEHKGSVVAINVNTGAILAMVSKPSYNPNKFVNGISSKEFQKLNFSKGKPMFNRALQGKYPPGSTVKPFLGLIALEHDIITPKYYIKDLGWFQLSTRTNHYYRDWRKKGHGKVNLSKAITESCDTFFII